MTILDQLVKTLLELDPSLDESALRFVGKSEGEGRLRELVSNLVLLEQLRK